MRFIDRLKNSLISKAAEGLGTAVGALILWVSYKIGPAVMSAIESVLTNEEIAALLLASLTMNVVIAFLFWVFFKKDEFKLMYGVYWDKEKNPHCPICRKPIAAYNKYQLGKGYYCASCEKLVMLTDAHGKNIEPQQAIQEL